MTDHSTDVGNRPELHDLMKALGKAQNPNEVEYDPDYPPFDEEQFQKDYYQAQKIRGSGYGSPGDF